MSILYVRERKVNGGQADYGANHFATTYIAKSDDPMETRTAVLNCGKLPVYGLPHPENMAARCVKVDAERIDGAPCFWECKAEWNVNVGSGNDPGDQQKPPDQRRAKWRSRFIPLSMARFFDLDGKPFQDAAGTPFDPPPDIPVYIQELTIFRYEPTCDPATQREYLGATNTDAWLGAGAGTALVDDISVEDEYIGGAYWFPTTYRILIKPRITLKLPFGGTVEEGGWNPEVVLNAGPMELVLDTITSKWTKGYIAHGNWNSGRPECLKLDGTRISIDSDTGKLKEDPTFLKFRTKTTAAFGPLNLVPPPGWFGV